MEKVIAWTLFGFTVLGNFAILVKMHVNVTDLNMWKSNKVDPHISSAEKEFVELVSLVTWRNNKVDPHISDGEKHLDQRRDGWRMDELQRRLERMEKKLDAVLAFEAKKKGETDE